MTIPNWMQSSLTTTPDIVSNRVKGAVLLSSSVIIFAVAQLFHISIQPTDIVTLATQLGTVVGAIWFTFGAILKFLIYIDGVYNTYKHGSPLT
jgi:hypothetical protein